MSTDKFGHFLFKGEKKPSFKVVNQCNCSLNRDIEGHVDMGNKRIRNIENPKENCDAVTLNFFNEHFNNLNQRLEYIEKVYTLFTTDDNKKSEFEFEFELLNKSNK